MVAIKIKKGLNIPLEGLPSGKEQALVLGGMASQASSRFLALNLEPFSCLFHLIAKEGDKVKIGDPIAEEKNHPGRNFVSPASGVIKEIVRGEKRVIRNIVIQLDTKEEYKQFPILDPVSASAEALIQRMLEGGIFAKIKKRPFNLLADPKAKPRSIFVKAIESAPIMPPAELQVSGFEKEFQSGLIALSRLTEGKVHLIHRAGTPFKAFLEAKNVERHTAEGPHPISSPSLHIQEIDPIRTVEDNVWVLSAHDVVCLGVLLSQGKVHHERVIGIGGTGVLPNKTGYFKVRDGIPIVELISGRLIHGNLRLISGDPLNGQQEQPNDYLRFDDFAFTVIPEMEDREFLHFFRAGGKKYSFSRAYLSGHRDPSSRSYFFSTNMHGEHRAFIDSTLYDQVQPLNISTMLLVKAVMAEDYDLAEKLGILEVVPEDFSLPAFVCPSKIEMPSIIAQGQSTMVKDYLQS
jgi:Na+-transporting NADH:ubiquinone oxidoreductase subunit A